MSRLDDVKRHLAVAYASRNKARRNLDKSKIEDLKRSLYFIDDAQFRLTEAKVSLQMYIADRMRADYRKSLKDKK